jgi:hypothetical protein
LFNHHTSQGLFGGDEDPAFSYYQSQMKELEKIKEELQHINQGIQALAEGMAKGFQQLSDSLTCQMAYYSQRNYNDVEKLLSQKQVRGCVGWIWGGVRVWF